MPTIAWAANPVTVWSAGLDLVRPQWSRLLDAEERQRWVELRQQADRERFLLASCLLRLLAGSYLRMDPTQVRLDRTCPDCARAHGKTRVVGTDLEVSVSHSGGWVLVAVATSGPVGVDIEEIDEAVDIESLRTIALTASESSRLEALSAADRRAAFFKYWTRKEAALKTTGDGLRLEPAAVVVSGPEEPAAVVSWTAPERPAIWLEDLDIAAGYAACVGYVGPSAGRPVLVRSAGSLLRGLD
jgi:4'-phosphopantetheinyl transferase